MDLLITLDSQSAIPLHKQLYEEIRRAVLSGRLQRGQRVPSTRALSETLGISRATVTLAYDFLLSEGYLQSTTGSGTYVCRQLPDELLRSAGTTGNIKKIRITESGRKLPKRLSKYGQAVKDTRWPEYGPEPHIQFSFGRPDMAAFPMRLWMQLYNDQAKRQEVHLLDAPDAPAGFMPLREAIASYLKKSRALDCAASQVIIVNGSQQAIDLVNRVLVDRGDAVGIEDPGYIGAKKAFEVQGANLHGFPVDEGGLKVEELKRSDLPFLKLVYVTPSHQFPTGVVLSLPRRLELLSWAAKNGTMIIEDDYDSEFRYAGRPVPALAGLDQTESVIYIGTFSKVLFPALRLGYLVVPPALVSVFSRAKWLADRHSALLEQQTLAEFLRQGHFERHVRRMRKLYEIKRRLVIETLKERFGNAIEIQGDNAGINILVRFKKKLNDEEIISRARQMGVSIPTTAQLYLKQREHSEFLLNYGGLSETEIVDGIRIFAAAVAEHSEVSQRP